MNREHWGDTRRNIPFWETNGYTISIIAMALGCFALGMSVCNIMHIAFGFNMTEEQKQEERLVPVCQKINASEIFIEGLAEQCAQFYGGPVP